MGYADQAPSRFAVKLRDVLAKRYPQTAGDPRLLAPLLDVEVRKLEGYFTGDYTPSLGTFGRMMAGVSNHVVAELVKLAREDRVGAAPRGEPDDAR